MRRGLLAVALGVGLLPALALPAVAAAGTLDQSQTNPLNASLDFGGSRSAAQTFTAGLSGVIDQVDLELRLYSPPVGTCSGGSGVTVEIETVSGGMPSDAVLASANVPAANVTTGTFGFVSFAVPAPPVVAAGTQYALVASAPDASCSSMFNPYSLAGRGGNPYGGGAMFAKINSTSSWMQQSDVDADFRTYVGPPPVGPPSVTATGQRAGALASCKKRARKHHWPHKRLRKCKKSANRLPV